MIRTELSFKVINLEHLLSPQTGAETCGQGVGSSDEVSTARGAGGEALISGHPVLFTTTSYRFPDGFEKFSPPILQLDEVDFYYDPKHIIFSRLSVSADLESRICVVRLLFLCSMSWDSPTPDMCCGLAQTLGLQREEAHRNRSQSLSQGLCCTYTIPILWPHRAVTEMKFLACGTL